MNNTSSKKTHGSAKSNGKLSASRFRSHWLVILLAAAGLGVAGTLWLGVATGRLEAQEASPAAKEPSSSIPKEVSSVFTTARTSFLAAVREYFALQSTPVQPIAFNHKIHIQNDLQCADCHTGVTQGPDAGIPSASLCMTCHESIDADKPEIKKLAAYAAKGQEPPWQPVFWFYPEVHVKFQHAPHVRNGVGCEQCHGDMSQRTVAVKTKDLSMNFCLNCHKAKGVSVDCIVCHN